MLDEVFDMLSEVAVGNKVVNELLSMQIDDDILDEELKEKGQSMANNEEDTLKGLFAIFYIKVLFIFLTQVLY